MPLSAWLGKAFFLAESEEEMADVINKIMNGLDGEEQYRIIEGRRHYVANQVSKLQFREDLLLTVSINRETQLGAMIWYAFNSYPESGEVYAQTWVSDGGGRPDTDPQLVSDPYVPEFHDPRNALPLPEIQAALEEFCRDRSGQRPSSIHWAAGRADGSRRQRGDDHEKLR